VSFTRLSPDGSICGLTAYADTEYIIEEMGVKRTIPLRKNQILLDVSFIQPGQVHKLCGKRRFTLAHECAHQILFQMESEAAQSAYVKKYSARTAYSLRDLKTREDWNEWQANVLGAAILMPQKEIDLAMWYFAGGKKLINYEGVFAYRDKLSLSLLCQQLAVSKSAAVIRLRQLGYIEDRPYREYLIRWRCGDGKRHPGHRTLFGDAGENQTGASCDCLSEDTHGEMPLLPT
jgi:hypothetical protein